jgi:hypothetical protein
MQLPGPVQHVVDAYLATIRTEAAGLVEGLYLVGSVALDDFQPHSSDIDFVAVTARLLQPDEVATLARVHTRLRAQQPRPFFDGIYIMWDDLAHDPTQLEPGPSVHEGVLHPHSRGERNPVTWHTLAQAGVGCLGPDPAGLAIWTDPQRLAAWTNANLDRYWRRLLDPRDAVYWRPGMAGLTAWACAWCVLGVTRLHYTLATGKIISKQGAGLYALETFSNHWQRVIQEALRIRRGTSRRSFYRSPLARRRDVLAFTDMVIAGAHHLYAKTSPDHPVG